MQYTTQPSLCVKVAAAQATSERGHAAEWTVSEWTTGGNVSDATVRLEATPASGGAPGFSLGCGSSDGTSACDLGAIDAKSAPRQLEAELTVPVTASTVTSVSLTVIGSAPGLANDPTASAAESITAPPSSSSAATAPQNPGSAQQNPPSAPQNAGSAPQNPAPAPQNPPPAPQNPPAAPQNPPPAPQNPASAAQNLANLPPAPADVTSPLPVGSLPSIPSASPTLSQGGNAGSLFPTIDPARAKNHAQPIGKTRARPVADTSALPEGAPVVGAQLAGLAALAVAFVLAVTRLSIRRHPSQVKAAQDSEAAAAAPPAGKTPEAGATTQEPPAASGDEASPGA